MSVGKAFFDSNVLLYMHSTADPGKQARAKKLFREYIESDRIVVSTQVVQEFHTVASRKLRIPLEPLRIVTTGLLDLPLIQVDATHIRRALLIEERYQISFWDALILAAAESAGADVLYTEDLNHGQQYGTVRVQNPFRELKEG